MRVFWAGPPHDVFAVVVSTFGFVPQAYPGDVLIVCKMTGFVLAVVRMTGG